MTIWDWAYIAGWALTMRYAVGFVRVVVSDLSVSYNDGWDGSDIAAFCGGVLAAGLLCLAWPIVLLSRLVYRGVMLINLNGHGELWSKLFPEPKKIEPRAEKQVRKDREREDENRKLKRRIAELEAETGVGREPAGY